MAVRTSMAKRHHSLNLASKLRQQLESKSTIHPSSQPTAKITSPKIYQLPTELPNITNTLAHTDTIYLKKDMAKIALLSTLAITAQLTLFFAAKNGLIFK